MLSLLTPLLLLLTTLLLHPFTSSAQKPSSPPTPNPLQQQQQQQQKQQQQPLLSPKNNTITLSPWHRLNNPIIKHLPSSPSSKSFTLTASPATDLWRPNSYSNNFSAPFVYRICSVENFSRISVTVVPGKEFKSQWDQGGIAILFPDADLWEKKRREEERLKLKKKGKEEGKGWWGWWKNDDDKAEKHAKYSWIKTGLEWENGGLQLSTVATYAFSDWSLSPVVPSSKGGGGGGGVRFLVERNSTELWIYNILKNHQRYPLREITWAFLENRGNNNNNNNNKKTKKKKKNAEIWVGVYVAKPNYSATGKRKSEKKLSVEFRDLRIEC